MGLMLDSSVLIAAERRGDSPTAFMKHIWARLGDQELALSAIGFTELIHGIYRADSPTRRSSRRRFADDLATDLPTHPYTQAVAEIAGRIDGEQTAMGQIIPYPDLLIGATALSLGFSVLTTNTRHFFMIPQLDVVPF